MKIEAGKYYRTRDGQKVGPIKYWQTYDLWVNGQGGAWQEDGSPRYPGAADSPRLVAEWSDPVDLTAITAPDYNDGKWHGWNGGECPVDPGCIVGLRWKEQCQNDDAVIVTAYQAGCWRHSPGCNHIVAFRVVKPAPPQPRTIYLCEVHGTRTVFDTAIAATREAMEYQHGEATVTEFVEVLK